jgi:AraC-like DNA-binding protein
MDGPATTDYGWSEPPLPRNLARAIQYLRDNLCEPLTLAMLVRASGLTERTLHKQFHGFLGVSPVAYLRRLRLLAAREALSQPAAPSVSEVAGSVGFAHLGRFAITYKAAFGETPSITRQRAQASAGKRVELPAPSYARPVLAIAMPRTESLAERRQAIDLCEQLAITLSQSRSFTVLLLSPDQSANMRVEPGRYCLSSRVAHQGPRARIMLALLDRETRRHLWGDSFDGLVAEPFALQDAVMHGVLRGVLSALGEAEATRLSRMPVECPLLALRALPLVFGASVPNAQRLIAAMAQAMEMDPGAALPTALTGLGLAQIANYFGSEDPDAVRAQAHVFYKRAVELDTGDPLVTTARAATASLSYWMEDADALSARAVAMDPTSHWAWERRGTYRLRANHSSAPVIAEFERALRLRPPSLPRSSLLVNLWTAHGHAGRADRATPFIRAAWSENPADWVQFHRVCEHITAGNELRARAALDDLRRSTPYLTADLVMRTLKGFARFHWLERAVHFGLPV